MMTCENCGKTKVGTAYKKQCESKEWVHEGKTYCNLWSPMPCTKCEFQFSEEECGWCDDEHGLWKRMTRGGQLRNLKDLDNEEIAGIIADFFRWYVERDKPPATGEDFLEWVRRDAYEDSLDRR